MTRRDGTILVAASSAMWGLDGLLRVPLATKLTPGTVVFYEHLIALLILTPLLLRAMRVFAAARLRAKLAVIVIGVGSSAIATALFTEAFALGAAQHDFVTPLVLQKLQPIFAILLAAVILGERLRARYVLFAIPALAGAWLLTFAQPFDVQVAELVPALLAVAAALLWGAGTVLGRYVSATFTPTELTTLRYTFGLIGASGVMLVTGASGWAGMANIPGLILLALIPGLISLALYYRGLRSTPASRATLAELAFPATAALVGVLFLGDTLTFSQWIGFAVVVTSITALSWYQHAHTVETVRAPALVDAA